MWIESNSSLDFHHIDETEKDFCLGNITTFYDNIEDLSIKISNERLEHSDDFFEKYKDDIIKKSKNLKEIQCKIDRKMVKEMYESGIKQKDIAIHFNASKGTISNIIKYIKNSN